MLASPQPQVWLAVQAQPNFAALHRNVVRSPGSNPDFQHRADIFDLAVRQRQRDVTARRGAMYVQLKVAVVQLDALGIPAPAFFPARGRSRYYIHPTGIPRSTDHKRDAS
jgi:hypothetical protein